MTQRYHRKDIHIERQPDETHVYDGEGERITTVNSSWSDDDIFYMLEFANKAFALGVEIGEERKMREAAKALGLVTKEHHYRELASVEKRIETLEQRLP